jgi:hypothetical protein
MKGVPVHNIADQILQAIQQLFKLDKGTLSLCKTRCSSSAIFFTALINFQIRTHLTLIRVQTFY